MLWITVISGRTKKTPLSAQPTSPRNPKMLTSTQNALQPIHLNELPEQSGRARCPANQRQVCFMESTGEFWKPLYAVLESSFRVLVVNAQHVKHVPGRKTDMRDAE